MEKSKIFLTKSDANNLTNFHEEKRLQVLYDEIVQLRKYLNSVLEKSNASIEALEILLNGKYTPTHDIKELKERLFNAKRAVKNIEDDIQNMDEFVDYIDNQIFLDSNETN